MFNVRWISSKFYSDDKIANKMIIIHHTGSYNGKIYSLNGTIDWFKPKPDRKTNKASAHYVIPRDCAEIIQMVPCDYTAWHAGTSEYIIDDKLQKGINRWSIGIELQGDGNVFPYTKFQYAALAWLVRTKMEEYNIPFKMVRGHEHIAPGRKVDPGKFFDWDKLERYVRKPVNIESPVGDIRGTDTLEEIDLIYRTSNKDRNVFEIVADSYINRKKRNV